MISKAIIPRRLDLCRRGRHPRSQTCAVITIHLIIRPEAGRQHDPTESPLRDPTTLQKVYLDNPELFVPNAVTNFRTALTAPRGLKEQVDAGYLESNTRWKQLRLNLGARHERTRTIGKVFDVIPGARIPAIYTAGTIPFINYQYREGRQNNYGDYDNRFFSGGAKYAFTRNLVFQVAASQSIGRPNYDNLAGVITIDETRSIAMVPNPDLKPETSDKYFVSVQYYIEPAGTSDLRLRAENHGLSRRRADRLRRRSRLCRRSELCGLHLLRSPNARHPKIKGVDFEYSQQLVFLPGVWRGISVFGSISRTVSELQLVGVVPKAANGGVRFSNHKFNLQLRSTWQSAKIDGFATNEIRWQGERLLADLSAGYKINRTYELTLSGRNITDAFQDYYSNEPGLLRSREILGPIWTVGVRGRF